MITVTYNGTILTQLNEGKTGVIDFADEKMRDDIIVEAAEDTEVRYKGAVLAKGKKIIIHCAGKIMRGEMRIAAAGRLKLDAPVIRLETDAADGSTTAILGRAILGKAILGRTSSLPKLDAPIIRLVEGDAKKLDAPIIYLDTGTEVKKLDAPTIYLQTDAEIIKLGTPTIYLETGDIPDEPDEPIVIKLDAPTIYLESDPVIPDEPDVPDEPEIVKLATPVIYIEAEQEPDEPVIIKLDAPVIYIEAESEPAIKKLAAPEIYLETEQEPIEPDEPTETYIYVQDDLYVGQARSQIDFWYENPRYSTQYEFNEAEGFDSPSGGTVVNSENAVGAYIISDTEVWVIESIEPAPDHGDDRYRVSGTVVASASLIKV